MNYKDAKSPHWTSLCQLSYYINIQLTIIKAEKCFQVELLYTYKCG